MPDASIRQLLTTLRRGLEKLYGGRLCGVFLFGSHARGQATPGSDVDVLIVLDSIADYSRERDRISHLTAPLSLDCGLSISTVLMPRSEWLHADGPFYLNVREDAIAA